MGRGMIPSIGRLLIVLFPGLMVTGASHMPDRVCRRGAACRALSEGVHTLGAASSAPTTGDDLWTALCQARELDKSPYTVYIFTISPKEEGIMLWQGYVIRGCWPGST